MLQLLPSMAPCALGRPLTAFDAQYAIQPISYHGDLSRSPSSSGTIKHADKRLLRLGAAGAGQAGGVGHAAHPQQRGGHHRHAHLRHGHGNRNPTIGAPYSSLAAAYDNAGISDNSDPAAADFDGTGDSFSKQALAAGTPTPLTAGGQATFGGTTFTWPSVVGAPDDVIADGQTIDLSGSGTDLGFLGASAFGAASGTGTITYTDGSTQQYSLVMTDWYNNAPVAGDQIATTTTSWNFSSSTQVTHPVSIYSASVPLVAGKTVASVTLPTIGATVGNGVTAMHIFAMAIGSGTPTGG